MSDLTVPGDDLEMRANLLRERLVRALDEIDRRRTEITEEITHVRERVQVVSPRVIKGGIKVGRAAALFGAGLGLAIVVHRMRTRDERLRRERIRALQRLWTHPEWVARKRQQSVIGGIARKLLIGVCTSTAMFLLRRSVKTALGMGKPLAGAGPHPALPARVEALPTAPADIAQLPGVE